MHNVLFCNQLQIQSNFFWKIKAKHPKDKLIRQQFEEEWRQDPMRNVHHHCCCDLVAKLRPTLVDPVDCSPPDCLSSELPRQEFWSALPFPTMHKHKGTWVFLNTSPNNIRCLHAKNSTEIWFHLGSTSWTKIPLFFFLYHFILPPFIIFRVNR